jgi:hypothetical protein
MSEHDAIELERENARLWMPIESAPRDGTLLLASDEMDYFICRWADCSAASSVKARYGWATTYDHECMAYNEERPTHWMPLPSLPNARGDTRRDEAGLQG